MRKEAEFWRRALWNKDTGLVARLLRRDLHSPHYYSFFKRERTPAARKFSDLKE